MKTSQETHRRRADSPFLWVFCSEKPTSGPCWQPGRRSCDHASSNFVTLPRCLPSAPPSAPRLPFLPALPLPDNKIVTAIRNLIYKEAFIRRVHNPAVDPPGAFAAQQKFKFDQDKMAIDAPLCDGCHEGRGVYSRSSLSDAEVSCPAFCTDRDPRRPGLSQPPVQAPGEGGGGAGGRSGSRRASASERGACLSPRVLPWAQGENVPWGRG